MANSLASLSFDATEQTSKPNSCIEASKSNAIRNSSSTINARRDDGLCAIGHLPWQCPTLQRTQARFVPRPLRFPQTESVGRIKKKPRTLHTPGLWDRKMIGGFGCLT